MNDWTPIHWENLNAATARLHHLLAKPLKDNRTWQAAVRLCIKVISEYQDDEA